MVTKEAINQSVTPLHGKWKTYSDWSCLVKLQTNLTDLELTRQRPFL